MPVNLINIIKKDNKAIIKLLDNVLNASLIDIPDIFDKFDAALMKNLSIKQDLLLKKAFNRAGDTRLVSVERERLALINYQLSLLRRTSMGNSSWPAKAIILKQVLENQHEAELEAIEYMLSKYLTESDYSELQAAFTKE